MTQREDTARALAFFEQTDDSMLLHRVLAEIAPRARRLVGEILARAGDDDDAVPPPADLRPAREPATKDQALRTVRSVTDFALLQVLARTVGQRVESAEIAASADFPEGARVRVPEKIAFPPKEPYLDGIVERTGTQLSVRLDNGETWQGPPSLAQRLPNR